MKRQKKQLESLNPKNLREAVGLSDVPPEEYDVTVIVHPHGNNDVRLEAKLMNIKRTDILAPDYGVPVVRSMVRQLEDSVGWGTADQ